MQAKWREWLRPEPQRYASGVPMNMAADAMVTAIQPSFGIAVIIMSVITVDPIGVTGHGLWGSGLLTICAVCMLSRTVPDRWVGDRGRLAIALIGAVAGGLLMAHDPSSWASAFAIITCVHAGIRFEAPVAAAVALTAGATAMASLAVHHGQGSSAPWWTGALPMIGVIFGALRRSRTTSLRAAHDLVEQTQRTAASEAKAQALAERARVARDIHDVLSHSLSGVNMQLSMADALFDAGRDEQARQAVHRARGMVVDGLGEARRAVQTLREESIELQPTLTAMLSGDHERIEITGIPTDLDTAVTQTIVRTAQEGLTNARRHAAGATMLISLSYSPELTVLEVVNARSDRTLSRAAGDAGSGLGLVGMRERAALIGGTVPAGPVTDGQYTGGWRVRLEIPCAATRAGQS